MRDTFFIDRMVFKYFVRRYHKFAHLFAVKSLRQILRDTFIGNVVRRSKIRTQLRVVNYQTVSITYSRIKIQFCRRKFTCDIFDKFFGFLRGNLSRRIIYHALVCVVVFVGQRNKIASYRYIAVFKVYSDGQRFKRRSSRIIFIGSVSHHRQVGNVASRFKIIGNSLHKSYLAKRAKSVDIRFLRYGKRRFAVQRFVWIIRHTVAQNHHIFHIIHLLTALLHIFAKKLSARSLRSKLLYYIYKLKSNNNSAFFDL